MKMIVNFKKGKLLLLVATLFAQNVMLAQKNQCGKFKTKSVNFTNSDLIITGGDLIFTNSSKINFSAEISIGNGNFTPNSVTVVAVGRDGKGSSASFEASSSFDKTTGSYTGTIAIKASIDNPIHISEVQVNIVNGCKETTSNTYDFDATDNNDFDMLLTGNKRPAKYGQHMIFSKTVGEEMEDSTNFVKLDSILLHYNSKYDKEKNYITTDYSMELSSTNKNEKEKLQAMMIWGMVNFTGALDFKDEKGNNTTVKLTQGYDTKLGKHVLRGTRGMGGTVTHMASAIQYAAESMKKPGASLSAKFANVSFISDDKISKITEVWVAEQKIKSKKEKYRFGKVRVVASHMSDQSAFSIAINLNEGSSIPASISMILGLVDCNNNTKHISIDLKYDSKTGQWTGSELMSNEKNCNWYFTDVKLKLVNACGDKLETKTAYFDELTKEWKCEDTCLKVDAGDKGLTCGKTDHF